MRYVYSIIRYVPNPASGEFVNVGAVAGSDEAGDWDIRQATNPKRAREFGPPETFNAALAFMTELGRRIDDTDAMIGDDISEGWLQDLQFRHRNVVQLSPPATVIADSADDALEFVFDQVITESAAESAPRGYYTRRTLKARLRTGYRNALIRPELVREGVVVAPNDDETRTSMDFVVGNGSLLQLAHAWSFQTRSGEEVVRQVKAWGYTLRRLRENGGFTSDEARSTIDRDIAVDVLFASPKSREQMGFFAEAQQVFRSLNVNAVPSDEAGLVASEAQAKLRQAGLHDATLA